MEQIKIDEENEEKSVDWKKKSINLRLSKATDWKLNSRVKWPKELEDEEEAKNKVESICSTFLTNPVIEEAKITIESNSKLSPEKEF